MTTAAPPAALSRSPTTSWSRARAPMTSALRGPGRSLRGQGLSSGVPLRAQRDRGQGDPAGHLALDLAQARRLQGRLPVLELALPGDLQRRVDATAIATAAPRDLDRGSAAGFLDIRGPRAAALAIGENWATRPDEELLSEELRRQLQTRIDALPEIYRTVFLVRDVDGFSTEETAEALGISVPTVKTRLHRARIALREAIAKYFDKRCERARRGPARRPFSL